MIPLEEAIRWHEPRKVRSWPFSVGSGWRDLGLSTQSCILAAVGDREVTVLRQPPGRAIHWGPNETTPRSIRPMLTDFFEYGLEPLADGSQDYLQEDTRALPGLRHLYRLPADVWGLGILREKLWIGGAGLRTPLHYDPVETLHWCLRGEKRFLLYRPGHRGMYSAGGKTPFISRVDPEVDFKFLTYPEFPSHAAREVTLRAGEVLYLPAYWWHHVTSLGAMNVSLNMVWRPTLARRLAHPVQWLRSLPHVRRQLARTNALKGQ